jgi:6-bladed beta-propeller/NHL repeat
MNELNPSRKPAARTRSGSLLALFLLAGWLDVAPPLHAQLPPIYLFQIDSSNAPGGMYPTYLAVDASNNLYVNDRSNDRVLKFDAVGAYLSQWGSSGTGNGQFLSPTGIAVDSSNNNYVLDNSNDRVEKFDGNGNFITAWGSAGSGHGQFNGPLGIAADSSNNVYVSDRGNYRIEKFDSNGHFIITWGAEGVGPGLFVGAAAIAVDSGNNVYVVDTDGNVVQKFDSTGKFLTKWGSLGSGSGQFDGPIGIAVDGSNHVYVVDPENYRIEVFGTNGTYLTQWGSDGSGNGQFKQPVGIAVDSLGTYAYVSDIEFARIQVFANTNIAPPFITTQPASQIVPAGINVTFSFSVIGEEPFTWQWSSNNAAVPDATNATLALTNVSLSDSGSSYSVLVTNSYGVVLSSNAVLTVLPAVAITLPATGISAAGAVLNGSVSGGKDTVVWFNWGTDTNYGNITATAIVPGGSGTTNLNAPLYGLSTNVYHYQIVATNVYGIVYGNDQSFVVADRAPTVTTLSPVGATNGATLYAMVNPNGLDTTVYFRWRPETSLTNRTVPVDAGAGANPLTISSLITGLPAAKQYDYQVVASNHLGTVSGALVALYTPPFVIVPNENWDSVASSADGSVLVAVANNNPMLSTPGGPIFISTNSGANWALAAGAPTNGLWETVACSADGSKMIAAGGGGGSYIFPIYTSPDMGVTWVSNNAPVINWQSVASSADGASLVAAAELNQVIYTSTNSGAVWTQATNAPKVSWFSVALSADGTKLAAVANGSTNIFTSPDFGATWITNNVPAGPGEIIQRGWSSIASSADGNKLIAAAGGNGASGFIFISTNSGAAWRLTATNILSGLVAHPWIYVASSADGSTLAAVSDVASPFGVVITSTNSGATWTSNAVPFLDWNAVALSADGAKLVATVGYPSTGPIYVSQATPAPILNLSASDNVISWTVPSLDFTLQQSSDLSTWTDMTNAPVLNFTTLENQVVLPSPVGNSFFRLKSN